MNPDSDNRLVYKLVMKPVTSEIRPSTRTIHMNSSVHNTEALGFPDLVTLLRNLGASPSMERPYIHLTVP